MLRSFIIALQFLSRIPLTSNFEAVEGDLGRSLLFYPLIGLLIGALLILTATLSQHLNLFLSAALVVSVWVLVTGALHLDGLADTTDAWIGGMGSKERTLEIMKDPASGPMGVLSLILLVLLKTAAIYSILVAGENYLLLIAPLLGRTLAILLMALTPYVREGGLGAILAKELHKGNVFMVSAGVAILIICISFYSGIVVILVCSAVLLFWRHLLLKRLQGCTGDTIGALIEVSECLALVSLAIC